MSILKSLFLLKGTLRVSARGYWYTPAGEKGSFGYYPHLKDHMGFPVYPDTEVKGNFRAALTWLSNISREVDENFISELFGDGPGKEGRERPSKIFFSDLSLTSESKREWTPSRFEIKPRIAVDEDTRQVENHMLVNLEMAYLEGLELESNFYLGYFEGEETLAKAKRIIESALPVIPGIGRSRSRGYGRGSLKIEWEHPKIFNFEHQYSSDSGKRMLYVIKALTNLRIKPVNPGSTQKLATLTHVPSERLRSWFVKTYHSIFGVWPTFEELSMIRFPDLYPALPGDDGRFFYGIPSPVTTLMDENGNVADVAPQAGGRELRENIFSTKTKVLPHDQFVTKDEEFQVFKIDIERRTRNRIGENFTTEEQGLYVQEFIRSGTHFWGIIQFHADESDPFVARAGYILGKVNPIFGGSVFSVERFERDEHQIGSTSDLSLVIRPIPFKESLFTGNRWRLIEAERRVVLDSDRITLYTKRGYRTVINRPKRPLICVKPGSVLYRADNVDDLQSLLKWKGFGQKLKEHQEMRKPPEKKGKGMEISEVTSIRKEFEELLLSLTSSQIGFLKEFLNPKRNIEEIKSIAEERIQKYHEKNKPQLVDFYKRIKQFATEDPKGEKMRYFIQAFIDAFLEVQFEKRRNK